MTSTIQRFETNGGTVARQISQATAIEQSRAVAEVQAAVIVAQNVPRDINRAIAEMRDSCGRLAMAEQAFYQVPNRGTGPSVHLARELARIWGNIEHGSNEMRRDDEASVSEIQGFAWDKQTNTRTSRTFIAPHEKMKAGARLRLTDLGDIQNNNNSVAARAVRECILNVLPKWFVEDAQNICRQTLVNGEGEPLPDRITRMVDAFHGIGITEKQIETKLGKKRGQFDAGDVAQMGITYTSITRDGHDKNELFPPTAETAEQLAATGEGSGPSKLAGKVKAANEKATNSTEEGTQKGAGADSTETQEAAANDTYAGADLANDAQPPGAPTASTPGQTERVAAALAQAKSNTMSDATRRKWLNRMFQLLNDGDCGERDDQLIVITAAAAAADTPVENLEHRDALTDDQLKRVVGQLNTWDKAGELANKIRDAVNTATIRAEQEQGSAE